MGILSVSARQLESLTSRIEVLKEQVNELHRKTEDKKLKKTMDSQDVCMLLNISPRTLQSYRDKALLPFIQIGAKFYYSSEVVEKLLQNNRR